MKLNHAAFAILSALALNAPLAAAPDVLMPGTRSVRHELVIEDSPLFAQYDIYVCPVVGFGSSARIEPGAPFRFSSKYGSRIWALAPGAEAPRRREEFAAVALASGDIPVGEVHAVPVTSPLTAVTTLLRIDGVENGVLRLAVVDEDTEYNVLGLAAAAAGVVLGIGGLVLIARRRRRAGAA